MADASVTAAEICVRQPPPPPRLQLASIASVDGLGRHREPKLPRTSNVLAVVEKLLDVEPPERVLDHHWHFMAMVMTHGVLKDVLTVEHDLSRAEFREALENAPPDIIDPPSWACWNPVCKRDPEKNKHRLSESNPRWSR